MISVILHYEEKRSGNTLSSENVRFLNRTGRVSSKTLSTQRVYLLLFSQAIIAVQTERKGPLLIAPTPFIWKLMNYRVALLVLDSKRNVPIYVIFANYTNRKIAFKNQLVATNEGLPRSMKATTEIAEEILGILENREFETKR